jgi:hypothetical protein
MSTPTKIIITELHESENFGDDNVKLWSMKVHYVLEEQEVLKTLRNVMIDPELGNTAQHKIDRDTFLPQKGERTAFNTLCSFMNINGQPQSIKKPCHKGEHKKSHRKKNLSKIKCFQCNKLGHYAHSCTDGSDKVTCKNKVT